MAKYLNNEEEIRDKIRKDKSNNYIGQKTN